MLKLKTILILFFLSFSLFAKQGCLIIEKSNDLNSVILTKQGKLNHVVSMTLVGDSGIISTPANKYCSSKYKQYTTTFVLDLNKLAKNDYEASLYKENLPEWIDLHVLTVLRNVPKGKHTYNTQSTYF